MLTQQIRKPKKTLFQHIGDAFRGVQQQPVRGPVNLHTVPRESYGDHNPSPSYTSKVDFIKFVEGTKQLFRVGDMVTLRMWPVQLGRVDPPPWYTVSDFQELQAYASFDHMHKQYRVVGLRPGDNIREGVFQFAAPAAVRPLTDQEKFLVNVRHQEKLDEKRRQEEQKANEGYSG